MAISLPRVNLNLEDIESFRSLGSPRTCWHWRESNASKMRRRENDSEFFSMATSAVSRFPTSSVATASQHGYVVTILSEMPRASHKINTLAAYGDQRHLYLIPGYEERLENSQTIFLYVEAEKAALAIEAWAQRMKFGRPLLVFATGGCYGWLGQIGIGTTANGERKPERGPLPEVLWAKAGRSTGVLFDSNATSNPDVRRGRKRLCKQLEKQGAQVSVFNLPEIKDVNGPDDFLKVAGDQALLDLLEGNSSEQEDDRPKVFCPCRQDPDGCRRSGTGLVDHALDLRIFQRSGELVRIVTLPEACRDGTLNLPGGAVLVEPISRSALLETFERLVSFQKMDEKLKPLAVDCPTKIAEFYLSRTGSKRLPVLTSVISAPLLLDDGTVVDQPGYHVSTGLYFVSDVDWLEVPKAPTFADAQESLALLSSPFSQFPFCTEADKTAHLAGILTAIQRRVLRTAPLFGFSAPERRTGKSLLAESLAIIATGRVAPATASSSDQEEFRKLITASLYHAHPVINLDNVERPLSSPSLCMALTQDIYEDRVLGESRNLQLPTRVLWTATGNNLTLKGDLTVRALLCSIDAGTEHPEERGFKIDDLRQFLQERRPELVRAALTILRAYHVVGKPRQDVKPWGGFDEWSRNIREALYLGRAARSRANA